MAGYSRSAFFDIITGKLKGNTDFDKTETRNSLKAGTHNNQSGLVNSGIRPYTGKWGQEQVLHLIRRTLFGVTKSDYDYFSKLSLSEALEILLKQSPNPQPPANTYNDETYADPDIPYGETWVDCQFSDGEGIADHKRLMSLRAWWTGLLLGQDRSLTEKMTLFWHSHITGEYDGMRDARTMYSYAAPLRFHSLGNFKQLVLKISTTPGMLQYLGGTQNFATAPNENYARELQELFTVGKGSESGYTQDDIVAAARVLTGWATPYHTDVPTTSAELARKGFISRPLWNGTNTVFIHQIHDSGNKQFSSFYNHTVIEGKTGLSGSAEINELIDMIFEKKEVAMHTCRKLYRWFVYSEINSSIEANVIEPLADVFIRNNYEIVPVLHALLSSEHFFDNQIMGRYIKNPIDHLIGLCRQFKLRNYSADLGWQYKAWFKLSLYLEELSMLPGYPPNVAGWPAYYLAPSYYQLWINSDTIVTRHQLSNELFSADDCSNTEEGVCLRLDVLAFTNQLSDPADLDQLITDTNALLSPVPFDPAQTEFLKTILLKGQEIFGFSGRVDDDSWNKSWKAYAAEPDNPTLKEDVRQRLCAYYAYLLQQAECQLI